jgi:putative oxidoreductase
MQTASFIDAWTPNALVLSSGLLVARLVFGLVMAAHGTQKLFGWFGGYGIAGTGGFFDQLGFRPGRVFATLASVSEVGGGLLVAFGFLGPVGPALVLSVMIVAGIAVHWRNGLFAMGNGIELTLLYAAAAVTLALTGPGLFSLDALFGLESLWSPALAAAALAVGIVGGVGNLAARRPAAVPAGEAEA